MAAVSQTKKIATLGVLAALSTVLTVLGTIISVNTVFFTAAAAFLAGIVTIRYGKASGIVFYFVCAALDFIVNPNKIHVILYLGLTAYLLISEIIYMLLRNNNLKLKEILHCAIRFVVFAVIYFPLILCIPQLFVSEEFLSKEWFLPAMIVGGIIGWFVYDLAYASFKKLFMHKLGKILP